MPEWGGKREGSGRKKGSKNEDTKTRLALRGRWLKRINLVADDIFDAHEKLALGHWFEEEINGTRVRVYKKSPDRGAIEWIMDQAFGKAPLKLEVEGELVHGSYSVSKETQAVLEQAIMMAMPQDDDDSDDDGSGDGQREEVPRPSQDVGPSGA